MSTKLNMLIGIKFREIYSFFEKVPLIGQFFASIRTVIASVAYSILFPEQRKIWNQRTEDVMSSPDNKYLPRDKNAGKIIKGNLIMHNGLLIHPGSYYGEGNRLLLTKNKGVHEPQEERAFMEILKHMPKNATMIELGSFWSFYSMWFHKEVQNPTCIMVEPDKNNLGYGKNNFLLNKMNGHFLNAGVGNISNNNSNLRIVTIDELMKEFDIKTLNILHSDVQGFEYDMLKGAKESFLNKKIDYCFISTHSQKLHLQCKKYLQDSGLSILADADLNQTYSVDGIIVAKRSDIKEPNNILISKKQ